MMVSDKIAATTPDIVWIVILKGAVRFAVCSFAYGRKLQTGIRERSCVEFWVSGCDTGEQFAVCSLRKKFAPFFRIWGVQRTAEDQPGLPFAGCGLRKNCAPFSESGLYSESQRSNRVCSLQFAVCGKNVPPFSRIGLYSESQRSNQVGSLQFAVLGLRFWHF